MKTTYTDKELQAAIDAAFPAGNKPRGAQALDTYVNQESWPREALCRLSIAKAFLEKLEAKPDTFEVHGKTWTRHTPGDAMPCDGNELIHCFVGGDLDRRSFGTTLIKALHLRWTAVNPESDIIGWRYADEQPAPETSAWTPAVGDVVRLKSGGPKMTVALLKETLCKCQWFRGDAADLETFEIATLQPVTE